MVLAKAERALNDGNGSETTEAETGRREEAGTASAGFLAATANCRDDHCDTDGLGRTLSALLQSRISCLFMLLPVGLVVMLKRVKSLRLLSS